MITCPDCEHPDLVAEVQVGVVIRLHCNHCGWFLPADKLKELNQIQAKTKPEFDAQIQKILEVK